MRRVPIGDLQLGQEERDAVMEVVTSSRISEGKYVRGFEVEFAKYIGTRGCVATSSGTAALITLLTSLIYDERFPKVKKGAKVITSPLTYVATVNAIVLSGLEPVFVDVDPITFGITSEGVRKRLASMDEVCMILPVHLMGYPCEVDKLNHIASDWGLTVVEDACQSHGSTYLGKKTGSLSLAGCFSFYAAHNIQAGELGAIVSDDLELLKLCGKVKAHGRACDCPICTRPQGKCPYLKGESDPRFTHEVIGYNFKPTEFPAAIANVQLKKADWIIIKRRLNVEYLNQKLEEYTHRLQLPLFSPNVSYLAYPIVIKDFSIDRAWLMGELEKKGVECRPLYGCIPTQQPAYRYLKSQYEGKLPNAELLGSRGFYLGCHQFLNLDDMEYVAKVFKEVLG